MRDSRQMLSLAWREWGRKLMPVLIGSARRSLTPLGTPPVNEDLFIVPVPIIASQEPV